MKTAKRDIKYIIKRIIIGVGVALVLANINKCNVYADTPSLNIILGQNEVRYTSTDLPSTDFLTSLNSPYSNYIYNYYNIQFIENYSYINFYSEIYNVYVYMFFIDNGIYDIDITDIKLVWDDDLQVYKQAFKCNNPNTSSCTDTSDLPGYMFIGGISRSFFLSNNSNLDFSNISTINNYSKTDSPLYNEYFYTYYGSTLLKENFLNDFSFYHSENINSFIVDNIPVDTTPLGYSEINLTDQDAVYFVPKDYNSTPTSIYNSIEFIDFPFYYKGSIRSGYFNIVDTNQMVFDPLTNLDVSSSEFTFLDTAFPFYYNVDTSDDLSAYIIFNNYGNLSIRYDSIHFDYYIVDNMSDYGEYITFINDRNEERTEYISFTRTLQDYWEEGFNTDNDYWANGFINGGSNSSTLEDYFQFLTLPFNFLRSLSRDKCQPISLPIPFVNENIQLNCLSSLFKSTLGNNFYNILFAIITGLYAYRITIHNIDTITDVVNPSDDKIEVIDL